MLERLGRRVPPVGPLCRSAGSRYSDYRDFSGGGAAVPSGLSADRLRLCVLPAVTKAVFDRRMIIIKRRRHMNIVVWKSPKMLRGILRKLFKVKA